MKLQLERQDFLPNCTIGRLFVNGLSFCDTLEDKVRDGEKIKHETAIPYGSYEIDLTWSNRFGKVMPQLLKVPNFEGIRIHAGNTDKDTSGCVLVGERSAETGKIINSRTTYERLFELLKDAHNKGEGVTIDIITAV
jgi:hypothetical protein